MSKEERNAFENPAEVRDFILPLLHENVITVEFTKVNGDKRVMDCTLQESVLPPVTITEDASEKAPNPDVLCVWSVKDDGWRSFRLDSVTSIKFGV